jgi:hypothetical protein
MKILLDECVPRPFKREFAGYEISTVTEMGWSGLNDAGVLDKAVGAGFAVLITTDQNLPYQQNIGSLNLGVIVIVAVSNRLEYLKPFLPRVLEVLATVKPGETAWIQ